MCTSLTLTNRDLYFGRTLDLHCDFGQQAVITPRKYPLVFRKAGRLDAHYALIGMAAVAGGYPLYAEAANEKGLCIAGLNFPESAWFPPEADPAKACIGPFELPLWLLGQCADLGEARALLNRTQVIAMDFSPDKPLTPLHWHIADASGSLTLECTRRGMLVMDNPVGVMTNEPPFDFHLHNLRRYMHLSPLTPPNRFQPKLHLTPFGLGMGAIGLPGDASPASRFVRAAFLKWNSLQPQGEEERAAHFFRLLEGVSVTRGSTEGHGGHWEYTVYASCINASRGIYYYRTYENSQINALHLHHGDLEGQKVMAWPLKTEPEIGRHN